MPVQRCRENGKPGFKFGESGKCYTYIAGDKASKERARAKAEKQGRAIKVNESQSVFEEGIPFVDKIILNGEHSLILGHKPEAITLEQVAKKIETEKQDISINGFFDSASPNYHTYYPNVTP